MTRSVYFRRFRGMLLVSGLALAACSDTTASEPLSGGASDGLDSAGGAGSSGGEGAVPEDNERGTGESGGTGDVEGDTDGGFGTSGGGSDDGVPTPEDGPFATCPEPLPAAWIFCEDFESFADPTTVFFDYADGDGNFVPSFDGGASGVGAMRAHYREGVEAAGFMSVSFGQNPINTAGRPNHSARSHFDEIYWRFRVKMQDGWPDAGPYNLTRISAFAQSDWGQAMVASIGSNDDDVVLGATASSCVEGEQVLCEGVDDDDALESIGDVTGTTPVFSSQRAGVWQCVEVHVKLNTPGESDGLLEMWVDGVAEGSQGNFDWRGSWSAFGLNLVSIENLWRNGAPADLDRWFDDLVISTEPIGCD